jgi:hypothetical protein
MASLHTKTYFALWTKVGNPMDIVWTKADFAPQSRDICIQRSELPSISEVLPYRNVFSVGTRC